MILYACIIICCFADKAKSQSTGIHFKNYSWQTLLQNASSQNKMIFIDCYTTWCGPCKYLAQNIFPMQRMGKYFNENFISVSYDMEKQPGIELKKKFGVTAYPTLLILNPRGYKVDEMLGNPSVDTLLAADSLIKWAAKSAQLKMPTPAEDFDHGIRNAVVLKRYITSLILNNQLSKAQEVLHIAITKDGLSSLLEERYWNLASILPPNSSETIYITKNKQLFYQNYGKEHVDAKLGSIFTAYNQLDKLYLPVPIRKIDTLAYNAYLQNIKERYRDNFTAVKSITDFYLACKNHNQKQAKTIADSLLGKATNWQYYRIAKMANELIYNLPERAQYGKWALHAANNITDARIKSACLTISSALARPYQDNAAHSHFELPDFD